MSINYRVGAYGFLADGTTLKANNGLRDQRKALEWVQNYISQFGGDPGHVVLGGESAGAASISLQMTAYGGKDFGLFQYVILFLMMAEYAMRAFISTHGGSANMSHVFIVGRLRLFC